MTKVLPRLDLTKAEHIKTSVEYAEQTYNILEGAKAYERWGVEQGGNQLVDDLETMVFSLNRELEALKAKLAE
jgi:hypothetical protein